MNTLQNLGPQLVHRAARIARKVASKLYELERTGARSLVATAHVPANPRAPSPPVGPGAVDPLRIDLSGRIALVTGGSGELGRVIVRNLGRCGAHVAVHYLHGQERAESLVQELEAHHGVRGLAVQADVGDPEAVQRMRDRIGEQLGAVDVLVVNAVSQYPWTTVLSQPIEDYDDQYRSCVRHVVLASKAFVPAMAAAGFGRVIGINTECSLQADRTMSAYVAGKRGMDGVLRVLAREVGEHGITVNQVAPGWMVSDKHRLTQQEHQPEYERRVPLRRRGTDQDVAATVAWLASEHAAFITGAFVPVCGGNVMPAI